MEPEKVTPPARRGETRVMRWWGPKGLVLAAAQSQGLLSLKVRGSLPWGNARPS